MRQAGFGKGSNQCSTYIGPIFAILQRDLNDSRIICMYPCFYCTYGWTESAINLGFRESVLLDMACIMKAKSIMIIDRTEEHVAHEFAN
jgi:hypothetical protein